MTAPGPKIASQRSGLAANRDCGGKEEVAPGFVDKLTRAGLSSLLDERDQID